MSIKSLGLKNFTVFHDVYFDFVPNINVVVGENGTGKTHILKYLYSHSLTRPAIQEGTADRDLNLLRLFQVSNELELVAASSSASTFESTWSNHGESQYRPVFIPAVDMLGHTRRFVSTYDEYNIDFDQTHRDITSLLLSPEKRDIDFLGIDVKQITDGHVLAIDEENERFYLTTNDGRFAAPLVAEGFRKLSTLVQLMKNGWIRPGSVLLWDEPEVNLNPILLSRLAEALLKLANAGVQIFLATHSYEFLQELDLQSKSGQVRYFALERTEKGVVPHPADTYDEIYPNKIAEAFDSIYDRVITKSTGRPRKNANIR